MAFTPLPSVVVIHLQDGEDLLLEDRVVDAKGSYGRKRGSNQSAVGTMTVKLSNYDALISDTDVSGDYGLDQIEQASITVGIGGTSLFHGRVRSATLKPGVRTTDVVITAHDAMAELGTAPDIDLGNNIVGTTDGGAIRIYRPREQTGGRIHAILDAMGWGRTAAFRRIDAGTVVCERLDSSWTQTPGEAKARGLTGKPLSLLQQVADTEWGRIGIAHGRPLRSRDYNRGLLVFDARVPPPLETLHVDQVSATLEPEAVRPAAPPVILPDKTELQNIIRRTDFYAFDHVDFDVDSIRAFGPQDRPAQHWMLCDAASVNALTEWMLGVYSVPRLSVHTVKIAPYLYDEEKTRICHRLSIDKVVRITWSHPASGVPTSTVHRIDRVNFHLRPGDLNLRDDDGNFIGGAICDMTLDLQLPHASAFWRYGVRGASELSSTTVFAVPNVDENFLSSDEIGDPHSWEQSEVISSLSWNTHMVNKLLVIYESEEERALTEETYRATLQRELPDLGAFEIERLVAERQYRARPATALIPGGGLASQPAANVISVAANRQGLYVFNSETGIDDVLAHVGTLQSPGAFRWDSTTDDGKWDFGNRWNE